MLSEPRPPVLLLTGTNAAAWTMENVRAPFEASGYTCESLSYRYHDLPSGPERDSKLIGLSIADYVEDARQAIKKIGECPSSDTLSMNAGFPNLFAKPTQF